MDPPSRSQVAVGPKRLEAHQPDSPEVMLHLCRGGKTVCERHRIPKKNLDREGGIKSKNINGGVRKQEFALFDKQADEQSFGCLEFVCLQKKLCFIGKIPLTWLHSVSGVC